MPFWKKSQPPPRPEPFAYLDVMRAADNGFVIQLRNGGLNNTSGFHSNEHVPAGAPSLPPINTGEPGPEGEGANGKANYSPMNATSDPPFYSTTIHRKKFKKDTAGLYHGLPASGILMAEIAGQKIEFHETEVQHKTKRRKLLFRKGVFSKRSCFKYRGTEVYQFRKSKNADTIVSLWPIRKQPKATHPIAVFEMLPGSKTRLGEIRLYEPQAEIDAMLEESKDVRRPVINNSELQPSSLLDIAVISWFTYRSFHTGGSLVDSLEFQDQP